MAFVFLGVREEGESSMKMAMDGENRGQNGGQRGGLGERMVKKLTWYRIMLSSINMQCKSPLIFPKRPSVL